MSQVPDPTDSQPLSDFGTAARRLRYGILGDDHFRPTTSLTDIRSAEDVSRSLDQRGWPLSMVLSEDGDAHLVVATNSFASGDAPQPPLVEINHRFRTDEAFARAMFGVLDVAGRVYGPRPARGLTFDVVKRAVS